MIQPSEIFKFENFEQKDGVAHAFWCVPEDCPYLEGHFPNQPVMPAIGLLDGSLELIRLCLPHSDLARLSLKKAKFTGLVVPKTKLALILKHFENRWDIEWKNGETGTPLASFSFRF